jgi:hypothetical protein
MHSVPQLVTESGILAERPELPHEGQKLFRISTDGVFGTDNTDYRDPSNGTSTTATEVPG